ncbi:hypothetical protein E3O44_15875 [Cryobacterium algoricola]|uniref:Fructose 1,6-bisphosphatase n=1 Tax=Cryobacterium algoricola TaxID=1259183 RepID=A0ABY2IBF6_9MICO|nr:hypothetical protein [Cryobacterium algoricola]TFB84308.1 hypothetical protein E3O44_15875 [Cryobacterium algoricola]
MSRWLTRIAAVTGVAILSLTLTSCTSVAALVGFAPIDQASQVSATAAPTATAAPLVFDSVFTDMGSIHPTIQLAPQLELQLDMWTEQKTHEWYTDSDKRFSFVISVFDRAQAPEAPFGTKRHVYMSNITVTATTTTASGASTTPFVLNVNPIAATLDPEALTGPGGLLVTSPKGGFQLESNPIGILTPDTYGLTLDFAMTIAGEATAGGGATVTQIVHQAIPVAIFKRM